MTVLAIVPARGGSNGIPGKNLAMCAGKPLIEWTLEAACDSALVHLTIVSTDSQEIVDSVGLACPLAAPISDEAQIEDRLGEVINGTPGGRLSDIIVLLQPTSPVRTGKQIDEAIEQLQREGADSLLSVVPSHSFLWALKEHRNAPVAAYDYRHRPQRQQMDPQYEENGSIYVFTREHWERTHNRLGGRISLYVMPEECRIQVDSPLDLWMAGTILERQGALIAGNNW